MNRPRADSPPPETPISGREVLDCLWRERRVLLAATIIAVCVGAVVTWMTPKLYAGDATIDIGDLGGELAQRAIDRAKRHAALWNVYTAYRAPDAYYISVEADSAAEVQSRLTQFTTDALDELRRAREDLLRKERLRATAISRLQAVQEDQARAWIQEVSDDLDARIDQNQNQRRELGRQRATGEGVPERTSRLEALRVEARRLADLRRQIGEPPRNFGDAVTVAAALTHLGPAGSLNRLEWAMNFEEATAELENEAEKLTERLENIRMPRISSPIQGLSQTVRPRLSWNLGLSATLGLTGAALCVLLWRRKTPERN